MNWYYCNDGKTVIGPLADGAMDALFRCGTITIQTRVLAEGTADWRTFGEAFKVETSPVPEKRETGPGRVEHGRGTEGVPALLARKAGNIDFASIRKWARLHKKAVGLGVVALCLFMAAGLKIHSKIQREKAGREFRERAMSRRDGSSAEDYFSSETEKMKRQLRESGDMEGDKFRIPCDRCDRKGSLKYNCDECRGSGVLVRGSGTELACPTCQGRGKVEKTCGKCGGAGKVLSAKPY